MARRSAVDGTVYQRSNGRWVAQVELPRSGDGKRRRVYRRARTRAEAVDLLRELRREYESTGTIHDARRTVREAVESYVAAAGPSDQTAWAANIVVDGLGVIRLAELTVGQCDEFLALAAGGKWGQRRIGLAHLRKLRQLLVAVLRNEMRLGLVARNVAEVSQLPQLENVAKGRPVRRALGRSELRRLLMSALGSRLVLIDLVGRNGLRPAEARGLLWSDVDLAGTELSITGQLDRSGERTDPKTNGSWRTIQLDTTTVARLKEWRDEQRELRLKAGTAWRDLDIVASTGQGTPVDRHSFARSLRLLCRRADISPPVTPYELRHTAISMQADAGRSSWELADWAGTSEAMINQTYRHRLRRVSAVLPVDEIGD